MSYLNSVVMPDPDHENGDDVSGDDGTSPPSSSDDDTDVDAQ